MWEDIDLSIKFWQTSKWEYQFSVANWLATPFLPPHPPHFTKTKKIQSGPKGQPYAPTKGPLPQLIKLGQTQRFYYKFDQASPEFNR